MAPDEHGVRRVSEGGVASVRTTHGIAHIQATYNNTIIMITEGWRPSPP